MPTNKSGEAIVQKARTMTLSPDGRKFKQAFDAAQFDTTVPVIPVGNRKKQNRKVKIQPRPIAGKGELKRLKLRKQAKMARGELAGATIRDFGEVTHIVKFSQGVCSKFGRCEGGTVFGQIRFII